MSESINNEFKMKIMMFMISFVHMKKAFQEPSLTFLQTNVHFLNLLKFILLKWFETLLTLFKNIVNPLIASFSSNKQEGTFRELTRNLLHFIKLAFANNNLTQEDIETMLKSISSQQAGKLLIKSEISPPISRRIQFQFMASLQKTFTQVNQHNAMHLHSLF